MGPIQGTYRNGTVILDGATDWPNGCRVVVEPTDVIEGDEPAEDPAAIERWVAEFEAIPAWEFAPQEEAEWRAARRAVGEYTTARMKERARGLP